MGTCVSGRPPAIASMMTDSTAEMTYLHPADTKGVEQAVALLASGGIAALPTETVYGLAADAANGEAVARVYAAKGRPGFNPLIVHVADRAMAQRYARFDPLSERLADALWPGPLTLVLPLTADAPISSLVTAGLDTVAIRIPAHPVMQAVIRGLGRGIAAAVNVLNPQAAILGGGVTGCARRRRRPTRC